MISIIIPMYNSEKYIDNCLKSIFENSYKNYEVIVIDDGSTDNSKKIVNKYKNVKLYSINHLGPGMARNLGIEKASGEYLFFVDSDDMVKTDTLNNLVSEINDNDILIGDYEIYYDNGKKEYFSTPDDSKFNSFFESVTIWNRLYKKDFIMKNKVRFEKIFQGEDRLFLADLYLHNPKIKVLHKSVYNWIRHDSSSVSTLTHIKDETNFNGQLACMIQFKEKLINNISVYDKALLLDHLRYSCVYLNNLLKKTSSEKCNKELFKRFALTLDFEKNKKLYNQIFNKKVDKNDNE